ncbi:hypothetical protein MOQ72_16830 [Saccharopolyspora sp. K220]|uniref:hypothetical protein n=1 Tax=Saccharopolyspora soli TaxID=2926618 RepID=UPI001F57962B|nr:hypothetical protein [Saccharopolyspora soli]MCI2419112.1 hypothetical protein [Saccharopolyspora soli]
MPLTDPWGESSTAALPGMSGGSVQVEPAAIPRLVNALQESLDAVGLQIEHAITELRIRPWAGDPVSADAAEEFNQRSLGGGEDALTALCGYRDQLQAAAESLELANRQYERIDGDSAAGLGGGC